MILRSNSRSKIRRTSLPVSPMLFLDDHEGLASPAGVRGAFFWRSEGSAVYFETSSDLVLNPGVRRSVGSFQLHIPVIMDGRGVYVFGTPDLIRRNLSFQFGCLNCRPRNREVTFTLDELASVAGVVV